MIIISKVKKHVMILSHEHVFKFRSGYQFYLLLSMNMKLLLTGCQILISIFIS